MTAEASSRHVARGATPSTPGGGNNGDEPALGSRARRLIVGVVVPLLVYGAVTGVYFWPVLRHTHTYSQVGEVSRGYFPWADANRAPETVYPQSDYPNSYYPRQVWLNNQLRAGELPEWNPYSFAGSPFLGDGGGLTFHPLRYGLARTVSPALVHDYFVMAQMFAAGVGAHVLARVLGVRRLAAYLVGCAYLANSTFLGWSQLEMMPAIVAGLPWALALLARWAQRGRLGWAAGAGVAAGLMPLGGSIDFTFAAFAVCGCYALVLGQRGAGRGVRLGERARWSRLGGPVVFAAVALAIGAPAIVPFWRLTPWLARQPVASAVFNGEVALPLGAYLRALWPQGGTVTDQTLHRLVFAGTAVAVLALVGAIRRGRSPAAGHVVALGGALAVGTLLLTAHTPVTRVLGALAPSFRSFSLGRFLFFWNLGLALLAAAGLERVMAVVARRGDRLARLGVRSAPVPAHAARAGAVVVIAVNTVQLVAFGHHLNPPFQPYAAEELLPQGGAITALRSVDGGLGGGRYLPVALPEGAQVMGASLPMAFELETGAGYESTFLEGVAATWRIVAGDSISDALNDPPTFGYFAQFTIDRARGDLLARNGITTVFTPPATAGTEAWARFAAAAGGMEQRYAAPDGELWSLQKPAPRAFVARQVEVVPTVEAAVRRYQSANFDWADTVVLTEAENVTSSGTLPIAAASLVDVTSYGNDRVSLNVDAPAGGWLVVLDSWAPGWSANVNGASRPVALANGAFRAVEVPAGRSTVTMTFRTPGLRLGLALAAIATLALVGWLGWWLIRFGSRPTGSGRAS